ncbi:MAG TPA: response regulator [Gaiellaceae bacterium]|nr:response regulator [Gaiellaceae bacterium]
MESLVVPRPTRSTPERRIRFLLAEGDACVRSHVSDYASELAGLAVLVADDGAEALRLGLQRGPQVALLDVSLPRLGGIEVAMTLRELRPQMRIALHATDPFPYRDRATELRLPLFDKRELYPFFGWLEFQVRSFAPTAFTRVTAPSHAARRPRAV